MSVPLAVKVGPFYTAFANVAHRLAEAGADGVVCFNRFLGPDIDLETLVVQPGVRLSTSDELRLPLRWIAILRGRVALDLAATGGAHTADDVVKLAARRCRRRDARLVPAAPRAATRHPRSSAASPPGSLSGSTSRSSRRAAA